MNVMNCNWTTSFLENIREAITAWLWTEDQKAVAGLSDEEQSRPIVVAV